MTRRRTAQLLAGLVVAAMVLVLTGCGKSGSGAGDTTANAGANQPPPAAADAVMIARDAADVPAPLNRTAPQTVAVELETVEVTGQLADGTTYNYWTFGGAVPGPMIRVTVGDTVELRLKNRADSSQPHSIDLHAVTGPHGGGASTQVKPGEEKTLRFQALNPGVYVYHCATPHVPTHIALGMYGLIVVEPQGGLPPVEREFYVMQGEVYTKGERGTKGHLAFAGDKMYQEAPDFVVFNGQFQGLTGDRAMQARVGERVRIFIGNGGPNLTSSFHIIGEIFDKVYPEGASEPVSNVQTTLIPAGGAAIVEFTLEVPGTYILVDHAISRALDKGAIAFLNVEGPANPAVFEAPAH